MTGGAGDGTMIRCNRWRGGRALDEFTDPDGGFTYPEVGATASRPLPSGYRHLSYRTRVGPASAMPAAAEAILGWRLHRSLGIGFDVSAPRAAPGVRATTRLGVGRLAIQAPCRVVWTVSEPERAGFAYGTLPGHPAHGEESFVAEVDADRVWFTVTSFSRPASWYTRAGGPVVPVLQRLYARRCGYVLRRLCR